MSFRLWHTLFAVLGAGGCTWVHSPTTPTENSTESVASVAAIPTNGASSLAVIPSAPTPNQQPKTNRALVASKPSDTSTSTPVPLDPDGNDDAEDEGHGPFPKVGHFERVGKAPLALRQICDLTPFHDSLYAAHALAALNADGATVSRYRKGEAKRPFTVAFDWNRPGQPTKGGGAGQGFLRIRNIGGRLFVPDADPPYNGFGFVDWGTEGYVFISNTEGHFASALRPSFRPPGRATVEGKAGVSVLPRAYHVFDVIRFRKWLIASTGSVPPHEKAWYGPSPGALHVANADLSRFDYRVSYPNPDTGGVYRLTYLVRFHDALYAGIEDYDGRAVDDLVVLDPPRDALELRQEQLRPLRITENGAAQTVRFFAHHGALYWIAWGRDGVRLRVTRDGKYFEPIALPADAGAPLDLAAFRGALVLLTEWGLYRLEPPQLFLISRITAKKTPFVLRDALCAAPLAVYDNELYAGGQTDGSLYRFVEDPVIP